MDCPIVTGETGVTGITNTLLQTCLCSVFVIPFGSMVNQRSPLVCVFRLEFLVSPRSQWSLQMKCFSSPNRSINALALFWYKIRQLLLNHNFWSDHRRPWLDQVIEETSKMKGCFCFLYSVDEMIKLYVFGQDDLNMSCQMKVNERCQSKHPNWLFRKFPLARTSDIPAAVDFFASDTSFGKSLL